MLTNRQITAHLVVTIGKTDNLVTAAC